jgi:hypothetical protein
MHLSSTLSNQRFSNCSPTVDVGFVELMSVFVETGSSRWIFSSAAVVLWFFLNNPSHCMTISFCQCWFLSTVPLRCVVFPWFTYDNITLKTVPLDTPNNVAVFTTVAPAKCTITICPLSKLGKSPIIPFFYTECHATKSLIHWHSTTKCKQMEEYSVRPT